MLRSLLRNAGIRPANLAAALRGWSRYCRDRKEFKALLGDKPWPWGRELPILTEWEAAAGSVGAYFHQDQVVARWILEDSPRRHVDIGSRIDGFIGHLSVFREVDILDIRPTPGSIRNVRFHQLDLMEELPAEWIACTDSLSCLHTIEHFGLGRYGDPLDPDGHIKGVTQLGKMVEPGGIFYLSTPIGPERIEFNAHRIFSPDTVLSWFGDEWRIEHCGLIDDAERLIEPADIQTLRDFEGATGLAIIAARRCL